MLLVDPQYRAAAGTRPYGHSGFTNDPAFQEHIGVLATTLPPTHDEPPNPPHQQPLSV